MNCGHREQRRYSCVGAVQKPEGECPDGLGKEKNSRLDAGTWESRMIYLEELNLALIRRIVINT